MEKSIAKKIMCISEAINHTGNALHFIIDDLADNEQKHRMRRALAEMGHHVYINFMRPVLEEYPELDPDKHTDSPFVPTSKKPQT